MTKQDELALLDDLIGKLPEGYIKDILSDFRPGIYQAMMNDFGFVGWREAWSALRELETEQKRLVEERSKIMSDIRDANRLLDHCKDELKDIRITADSVVKKITSICLY